MKIFSKKSVWLLISIYLAVWLVIVCVGASIANDYKEYIDDFFGLQSSEYVDSGETINKDTNYFKSAFMSEGGSFDSQSLWEYSVTLAERVQQEGSVLLWDNNDALPLGADASVSCFGRAAGSNGKVTGAYRYSGTGSGVSFDSAELYADAPTVYSALTNAGLKVNKSLYDWYCNKLTNDYSASNISKLNEIPWSEVSSANNDSFSTYDDAAIIFVGRHGGENAQISSSGTDCIDGDYLQLHKNEKDLIESLIALKKDGVFGKVIVMLNIPSAMNVNILMNYKDDIDCCVWVGQSGYVGLNAVGNILSGGKSGDIRPSGHIPFALAYNVNSAPAVNNGREYYTNAEEFGIRPGEVTNEGDFRGSYLVYAENIYVGYKYYETRYEDAVLGDTGAASQAGVVNGKDSWSYSSEVAYPFGWSAFDKNFEYSGFEAVPDENGNYKIKVKVTNNGSFAAADVVQIFIQKPYTEYDREKGLEQASVELCGYARTGVIPSGSDTEVEINVSSERFKTYDSEGYKTYIREAGTYFLTAASDSHKAVNNILAAKGKTPENTGGVMDDNGDESLVQSIVFDEADITSFSLSQEGYAISNRFEHADWNKYKSSNADGVTYLSRSDWSGTYPSAAKLSLTSEIVDDMQTNIRFERSGMPTAETFPTFKKSAGITLVALKGLDYDDPLWETLLNQLTIEDYAVLLHGFNGSTTLNSISKPKERVYDGPIGCRGTYVGKVNGASHRGMTFPSGTVVAATFDDELARLVGDAKGEGLLHMNASGLYGTATNLIRTHYCGRNFEYYSEDPFLSGKMGERETAGLQGKNIKGEEKGTFVTLKHFVLNEDESNRYGISTWVNEQTMREVYLAAFEPSITEARAKSVMTSFARVGPYWAGGDRNLMTEVLRNEWGFDGYTVSDGNRRDYMGVKDALFAGNDFLLNSSAALDTEIAALVKSDPTFAHFARESVHRILYVNANCSAVNGLSASTLIVPLHNWWQDALLGVQIFFGIVLFGSVAMYSLCFVFGRPKAQKAYVQKRKVVFQNKVVKYGSVEKASSVVRRNKAIVIIAIVTLVALVVAYLSTSIALSFTAVPRTFDMTGIQLEISGDSAFYEGDDIKLAQVHLAGVYADGRMKNIDLGSDGVGIEYLTDDGKPVSIDEGIFLREISKIRATYNGFVDEKTIDVRPGMIVFEAEDAIINAPSGLARTASVNTASGGRYVGYLADETEGASITYYILSDAEASADIFVTIADPTTGKYSFDDMFSVTINGKKVDGIDIDYEKQGGALPTRWSTEFYASVVLDKGLNEIIFERNIAGTNFDCISISCESNLSSAIHHLEAEDAVITGVSYGKTVSDTASGGVFVDKVAKLATDFVFDFQSDGDSTANLFANFARSSVASELATMIESVTVNGTKYSMGEEIENTKMPTGSYSGFSSVYLCDIELQDGENKIIISVPKGGNINFYNFDCLSLVCESNVVNVKRANVLEAENAEVDGKKSVQTGTSNNPSGGAYVENPSYRDEDNVLQYGSFTFEFNADAAGKAELFIRLGSYGTTANKTRMLSKVFGRVAVNSTEFNIGSGDDSIPDKAFSGAGSGKYYEWSLASLGEVDIVEGLNTITIYKAAAGDWLNFDCMIINGYMNIVPAVGG